MKKAVSNMSYRSMLLSALTLSLAVSISGCSGGDHAVTAPERVDAASELARANAPKAEDFEFAETESVLTTMTVPDPAATDTDGDMDMDGAEAGSETEGLSASAGADLYNNQCMACHASGLLNAPKFGDAADWAPRIEKGLDTLTDHSANGFNQMPAQAYGGTTVEQIRAAVEYMVDAAS